MCSRMTHLLEKQDKQLKETIADRVETNLPFCGYCKFGNFRENFIFTNSVKTHICYVKNARQGRELPLSVNDKVISPIREGFIFTKLRISRK